VRPARLLSARVTAVTRGDPAIASVALQYGVGMLPARLIVDLAARDGSRGSATVDGDQVLLEVPVESSSTGQYSVAITASYRVFGTTRTVVRTFAAE
jgi:hypothetical protein